jgi:exopolysaccharide production protein ExoQ
VKKILRLSEDGFTIVSLILYSGGPLTVLFAGGMSEGEKAQGAPEFILIQLILIVTYVVSLFLLLLRWEQTVSILFRNKLTCLLVGVTVFSISWTFIPELTALRSIALVGSSLFGIYIATHYSVKQQLYLLAKTFGLIILLSIVFAVLLPKYGIMSGIHEGAWRGIYFHKNVFGKMLVLSTSIFLLLATDEKKNRLLMLAGLSLSVFLILLTKSASSLIQLFILGTAQFIFRVFRWRDTVAIPVILMLMTIALISSVILVENLDALFGLLGKDATLTGRTDLWPAIITMFEKQPWIGYGYSGFWHGWDSEAAYVWKATKWTPPNSHNGFLDLLLDLGILGLLIFLLDLWKNFLRSLIYFRKNLAAEGLWPLLFLTYLLLVNITESSLLTQNNIFWVLYISTFFSLSIEIFKKKKPS